MSLSFFIAYQNINKLEDTSPAIMISVSVLLACTITDAKEDKIKIPQSLFLIEYCIKSRNVNVEIIEIMYPTKLKNPRNTSFLQNISTQAYKISELIGRHKFLLSAIRK